MNGEVLRNPSENLNPLTAEICHKGLALEFKRHIYIVMNKPAGVLSASTDAKRETVVDLVPQPLGRKNLAPVGRLDKDTVGLLILTDDGQFAHKVISPKSDISKVYEVELDAPIPKNAEEIFSKGVVLADGTPCLPARLTRLTENTALVEIKEGKYHQIKRMFGVLDLGVNALKRLSIGGLKLPPELNEGECRELSAQELEMITRTGNS